MILTRSPFYINVPFPNNFITQVNFELIVGVGSLTVITELLDRDFTKLNPGNSATNTWLDISPYIRDYFEYAPVITEGVTTPSIKMSGDRAVLATRTTVQPIDSLGSSLASFKKQYYATDGYGYYTEGQNNEVTKKILLSHQTYKADARGYFIVPLQVDADDSQPTVNGVSYSLEGFGGILSNNRAIRYLIIPCANYTGNIAVTFEGESIDIELIEECKYDVKEMQFINRYGVFETLHFYKASKKSIETESKDFKNNFTNGLSYDTQRHQIKKMNVMANESINIETGFLNPYYNDTIAELLQSEYVWLDGVPVNVNTSSLEYKTRIVDKLISYSLDFEYAYDKINNV